MEILNSHELDFNICYWIDKNQYQAKSPRFINPIYPWFPQANIVFFFILESSMRWEVMRLGSPVVEPHSCLKNDKFWFLKLLYSQKINLIFGVSVKLYEKKT